MSIVSTPGREGPALVVDALPGPGPGLGRSPSVKDVAAAAGVSLGTVSNVLNRPARVSPATRLRVERAMLDLGFVRNESARQLRMGTSRTLAYVMLDASNPFFTDVAQGMELAAEGADITLFLCNSNNSPTREASHLAHLMQQRVQGILLTPLDANSETIDVVAGRGVPVVLVDRRRTDHKYCSVAVDDELGGRLAIEHLVDRGHRRVAFVGGPDSLGQIRDRLAGARQAWSEAGRPAADLTVVPTPALNVAEGRGAGERLAGLPGSRRPTAAFCGNDLVALGLLQQVIASGRSVPGDLAIVGYDDIYFAAAAAVPLTSVRQPRQELGRTAAQLVLAEGEPGHTHQQVVFEPELVARASTTA
jgi:LacI family transcriptional regulator